MAQTCLHQKFGSHCKEPQIRAKGTEKTICKIYCGIKDLDKFWVLFKDPETQPHP